MLYPCKLTTMMRSNIASYAALSYLLFYSFSCCYSTEHMWDLDEGWRYQKYKEGETSKPGQVFKPSKSRELYHQYYGYGPLREALSQQPHLTRPRSEERREGKEYVCRGRSRWG